jgi:putative hydrolase of the HAD superfamily
MIKPKISTIVFDLGNVLVDVNYKNFTDAMHWDYEQFIKFVSSVFFSEYELGKHSEDEFFNELSTYVQLQEGDKKRYRDNLDKKFPLRPRTWAKVHYLRKKYQVLLFSNTNILDYEAVDKKIEIKRVIRYTYVSYIQGFNKPDPESYKRVEALFNINPAETLFVDDKLENIEGALKAGWHAEQVENEQKLFDVLDEYGIV